MNLKQINEIRASAGLQPLQGDPQKLAKARRQARNAAERAAANRDLKAKRQGRGK